MIKFRKTTSYIMERYPRNCGECPCFSQRQYTCMNERGYEGYCELGYMNRCDTRDFFGRVKFSKCQIEKDACVKIIKNKYFISIDLEKGNLCTI